MIKKILTLMGVIILIIVLIFVISYRPDLFSSKSEPDYYTNAGILFASYHIGRDDLEKGEIEMVNFEVEHGLYSILAEQSCNDEFLKRDYPIIKSNTNNFIHNNFNCRISHVEPYPERIKVYCECFYLKKN